MFLSTEQMMFPFDERNGNHTVSEILPVPFHILFWYILRGWSKMQKAPIKEGTLIAPKHQWMPHFIKLISSQSDWIHVLKSYALSGARLDNHPCSVIECIEHAFEQKNISEIIISEMCESAGVVSK